MTGAPAGLPDRQTAEQRVLECSKAVQRAIFYAAQCSAAAGMAFNPGIDIGVDLSNLRGVSQMQVMALEQKAAAVRQAIKSRMEYAAAQADYLASLPVPPAFVPSSQELLSSEGLASPHSNGIGASHSLLDPSPASPVAHSIQSRAFALPGHEPRKSRLSQPPSSEQHLSLDDPAQGAQRMLQHSDASLKLHDHPQRQKPQPAAQNNNEAGKAPAGLKLRRLRAADVKAQLEGRWLQFFWPDDGSWWRAQVTAIDMQSTRCTLLYETGEEETNCNLGQLVGKGEVAWLDETGGKSLNELAPAAGNGMRHSNSIGPARMSGDPESVVGPHVPADKVNKRARSAMRSRASGANLKLPQHLADPDESHAKQAPPPRGQSNGAHVQQRAPKRAKAGSRYKSDSEEDDDISSLSESDGEDFVPARKTTARSRAAGRPATNAAPPPQLPAQLPHHLSNPAPGLSPILALDADAMGRWVSITPLRQQSTAAQAPQAIPARIVKVHAGRGFIVVATSNGAALELHQADEGRVYKVAMLPASNGK
ncbi:hypothetical protein WJX73_008722 [Symbiochloris irregularis]|uniref:Tudor domain-containing protein n=1 Tax=Symbiochloris irregularis TaxID=706552 RepID=A0AAW1P2A1_9CHLO